MLSFVFIVALHVANYYVGLVIYARYQHCDPHTAGVMNILFLLIVFFVYYKEIYVYRSLAKLINSCLFSLLTPSGRILVFLGFW